MSVGRFWIMSFGVLALAGCSQKQSASDASSSAPQGSAAAASPTSAATTIPVPANQDVTTTVTLPPNTRKVGIASGAASFPCKSIAIVSQDGGVSNNFTDGVVPADYSMTVAPSPGPGSDEVTVKVSCHGGAAASKLVITPGS